MKRTQSVKRRIQARDLFQYSESHLLPRERERERERESNEEWTNQKLLPAAMRVHSGSVAAL